MFHKQERKAKRLLDLYLEEELDKQSYQLKKQALVDTISALKNDTNNEPVLDINWGEL